MAPAPNSEVVRQQWSDPPAIAAWRKWEPLHRLVTRSATLAIIEAAHAEPGMSVLDLASGSGEPALALAEAVGPSGHVTATDLVPEMLGLAEETARERGLTNITFRQADVEALPFPDETFDVATCRFGVMYFPDVERALGEIRRVLKPGGRGSEISLRRVIKTWAQIEE